MKNLNLLDTTDKIVNFITITLIFILKESPEETIEFSKSGKYIRTARFHEFFVIASYTSRRVKILKMHTNHELLFRLKENEYDYIPIQTAMNELEEFLEKAFELPF